MNALVHLRFTLDIPHDVLEHVLGMEDDGTDSWYEQACYQIEKAVEEDWYRYIEYAGFPEVNSV